MRRRHVIAMTMMTGLLESSSLLSAQSSTSIFSNQSTPAREVNDLALFVIGISTAIFLGVSILLIYALVRFRARPSDVDEPPQVFGSMQIELAWTIIPILIIVVLFLGTARVLFSVQDAHKPANALDVTVIGHQFWWEFRYPTFNVVTANELHVPVSPQDSPHPTFMKLTSADVMHSFWVPQLAGKTDLLPNRVNEMWIDPHNAGLYIGQCAQFCGMQHAKMLLRVYVDTPEDFAKWIAAQQQSKSEMRGSPAQADASLARKANAQPSLMRAVAEEEPNGSPAIDANTGQRVFERQACINCHTVSGTVATGRYGPDLTHLMSRATLAAGAMPNNADNLQAWIADPNTFKPGSLMPAMHLSDQQNAQITAYLITLK